MLKFIRCNLHGCDEEVILLEPIRLPTVWNIYCSVVPALLSWTVSLVEKFLYPNATSLLIIMNGEYIYLSTVEGQ